MVVDTPFCLGITRPLLLYCTDVCLNVHQHTLHHPAPPISKCLSKVLQRLGSPDKLGRCATFRNWAGSNSNSLGAYTPAGVTYSCSLAAEYCTDSCGTSSTGPISLESSPCRWLIFPYIPDASLPLDPAPRTNRLSMSSTRGKCSSLLALIGTFRDYILCVGG
jgi:hypothetical protein